MQTISSATSCANRIGSYPTKGHARYLICGALFIGVSLLAQVQPEPAKIASLEEETIVLSPFAVNTTKDRGYQATNSLAGTRIRANLEDLGSAISVVTKQQLLDLGATNNETLLSYSVNMEIGGPKGNYNGGINQSGNDVYNESGLFADPNANSRVRGLTNADNTRNYFLTDIPWDSYVVSRVDILRGPNGILFGLGSPAGVINATTEGAVFKNQGSVAATFDKFGSRRFTLDYNRVLLTRQLAARISLLDNDAKFQQRPAFSHDRRAYAALDYRPEALNRNGMFFEVSGNFEHGEIDSNRPRIITPNDQFSRFWAPAAQGGLNKATYDIFRNRDLLNVSSPQFAPTITKQTPANDIIHLLNSNRSTTWIKEGLDAYGAYAPDGTIAQALQAPVTAGPWPKTVNINRAEIISYARWASQAGKKFTNFAGARGQTMSDPSVFDFYNTLLDGPNKGEWTNWNVYNLDLQHTFLDNQIGYYLTCFQQRLDRGQWQVLSWNPTIKMDINQTNSDLTANPDIGRAYTDTTVFDANNGTGTLVSNRKAWRAQVFGEYDFGKKQSGVWAHTLGRQRVMGVASDEDLKSDSRNIRYSALDQPSMAMFTPTPYISGFGDNAIVPSFRYYLSGDLRGRTTAAGSNLSGLALPFSANVGGPITVRRFDNTWTAGSSVNPGAAWVNPDYPADTSFTQANNPANYRGWTDVQANLVTFNSKQEVNGLSAHDYLTNSALLRSFNVKSKVFVWEGHFWDNALVGMYGYRKDSSRSYLLASDFANGIYRSDTRGADLTPGVYNFANPKGGIDNIDTTSRNWSAVAHLNNFLGKHDFLPINVTLAYNKGMNFQPLAGRVDAFGKPLPPPKGTTTEKSILLATKDNKYTLRLTRYQTEVLNGNSTSSLAGQMFGLDQELSFTADMARQFRANPAGTTPDWVGGGGDPAKLFNDILPAWFAFEKSLKAKFPDFVNTWFSPGTAFATDSNASIVGVSYRGAPAGFAYTEDSVSKGYEVEFLANPTPNWRILVNAAKTTAIRSNVPGAAFAAVAAFVDNAVMTTDVGLAPVWWRGNTFGNRNFGPYPFFFRSAYLAVNALNGQSASDLRKYRANVITSYDFTRGNLKGFGVGGGYRWEDRSVVAYAPRVKANGDEDVNLNAPFYAPSEKSVDLWFSYSRKLSKDLKWRIQLNVDNVFGKNELRPLTASVDYEKLGTTVVTPTTVIPMKASAFYIKQGVSWQISNTIEF